MTQVDNMLEMAVSLPLKDEEAVQEWTAERITCSAHVIITAAEVLLVDLWKDPSMPTPKEAVWSAWRESALHPLSHMGKSFEAWSRCIGTLRCSLCPYRSTTHNPTCKSGKDKLKGRTWDTPLCSKSMDSDAGCVWCLQRVKCAEKGETVQASCLKELAERVQAVEQK